MAFIMLCVRRFFVTIQAVWDGFLMVNSNCLESIMLFPWIIYNFFFISVFKVTSSLLYQQMPAKKIKIRWT